MGIPISFLIVSVALAYVLGILTYYISAKFWTKLDPTPQQQTEDLVNFLSDLKTNGYAHLIAFKHQNTDDVFYRGRT